LAIRPNEITAIIKEQIEKFGATAQLSNVGTVIQVGDGIAKIYGLSDCMSLELIKFPRDVYGLALNLEEDTVGAVLLAGEEEIEQGDRVETTGRIMEVPVGAPLLGRVVDGIGRPIDGKGPIAATKFRPIERRAEGVVQRQPVSQPLQTGIKAIDSMIPIGRGQGVFCVYVAIGQKRSTVVQVVETLERHGAMEYTTVVSATASDPAPLQYIAPYAGCAMGEEFMYAGKDALMIFDDLSKHAWAYRQMSLLLRRPSGREAYPGDVFYLHSRLLERAAKLNKELGGGSLTAIPIIETQLGDISTYIPTNVWSITDGQIILETGLFNAGVRPAINAGISVSRVGSKAQIKAMKQVAGRLRLDLAQYRELAAFAQFGAELDKATLAQLAQGERMVELLKQEQYKPVPVEDQVIAIFAGTEGFLTDVPVPDVQRFAEELAKFIAEKHPEVKDEIRNKKVLDDNLRAVMKKVIEEFKAQFVKK
jgi:F-type H+-transporting ATPase subunit alpha